MHILSGKFIGNKGYDSPVFGLLDGKAGLLEYLSPYTVIGAFPLFRLAADAYPFVVVFIVLLFCSVDHQVHAVALKVAYRRSLHITA